MNRPYPQQCAQDWLTQQWWMWFGQAIDPDRESWLLGPLVIAVEKSPINLFRA